MLRARPRPVHVAQPRRQVRRRDQLRRAAGTTSSERACSFFCGEMLAVEFAVLENFFPMEWLALETFSPLEWLEIGGGGGIIWSMCFACGCGVIGMSEILSCALV